MTSEIKTISVVVPVYNERENLPALRQELERVAHGLPRYAWEWVFVDDGSRDGSTEPLRAWAQADDRVKLIFFTRNYGQTAAMSCGIKRATGDVILPMDADLQNDPADIPRFLHEIEQGFDCVSGWRKTRQDGFWIRRVPSWLANRLISWVTGVSLHDYGCSLKAYKRSRIQEVSLYGEMHRFIPAYVAWSGGRVTELIVHHRPRIHGVSKYGLSRIPKVLLDLFVVQFLTRYFNRPMHIFGGVGFVSIFLGALAETLAVYFKLTGEKSFIQTPLPTIGAMFIIVGMQFIMTGLLAEVLMRTYYETQEREPYAIRELINLE